MWLRRVNAPTGVRQPRRSAHAVPLAGHLSSHAGHLGGAYRPAGDVRSRWRAATAPAQPVGRGFFPLDEELALGSGGLTPQAEDGLVRLSTWLPLGRAAQLLAALT